MNCLCIIKCEGNLLLVGVDLLDIYLPYLLNVLVIRLNERLLHLNLSSENEELVVEGRVAEFTIHQLENRLEPILHL